MRLRTILASTVIGLTTLTTIAPATAQSTSNVNPVAQASARLDAQYNAWNLRTERQTAAAIAAINRVAATNPAAANTIAARARAAIRLSADRTIASANRSQAALVARFSQQTDNEQRIRSLGAHHARFNALVNLKAEQCIMQIDAALAAATGG